MKPTEIDAFCKKILKDNTREYIDKQLGEVSRNDLYDLANKILDTPFRFKNYALVSIVTRLFDDTPEFMKLLITFLEKTYPNFLSEPLYKRLEEKVAKRSHQAFALVKSMAYLGNKPGVSSGYLLSLLVGEMEEAKDFMIKSLSSNDVPVQRCSLMALHSLLYGFGKNNRNYLNLLEKIAPNISQENLQLLISCLQCAFEEYADEFRPVLESELIRRGADAASVYIEIARGGSATSAPILQKAVEILESKVPDSEDIDVGLAKIYENNPDFVVERIKERLLKRDTIELMDYGSLDEIKKCDVEPIMSMVESLIDEGKLTHLHNKELLLGNLFLPAEYGIAWCEKWSDDERKERVIISSLRIILTELINYESSEIRDRAVELVKVFARNKGIDYEKETGGINYKSDPHAGWENKEKAIKALQVLEVIQSPKVPIDVETLTNNLKKAPHLSKAIGANWLIEDASSDNPHILAYIFSQKLHEKGELLRSQTYWDDVFKILDEHNVHIPKKKVNELKKNDYILSEFEVFSRLAPFFEITIEPDIEGLGDLDALIDFEDEKALIEVATVQEKRELSLAHGGITVPGGKVKNVLRNKFEGQLKEGKSNPLIPILIILNLENFRGFFTFEVPSGIYGELQFSWKTCNRTRNDIGKVLEEGYARGENGFYDIKGTNIVTAIGAYERDLSGDDPLVGKLYRPPVAPVNKMSQNFYLIIRNALFGKSETSDWKSLKHVYGIDEKMAQLLYSSGIEDRGILAGIHEDEFVVEGVPSEKLSQLRDEARRVIGAISTDSVRFLKGMNRETLDILQRKGIYLIKDILELEAPPEDISPDVWTLITEDAKTVLKSE
ncbi:MAG: hypothetical protein BA871_04950 [Desulfuromonadales bacterium C00003096]|nr:MAG: hypothetical protein BA871_04950 [Desulfuromonadales bacterium C00003096]